MRMKSVGVVVAVAVFAMLGSACKKKKKALGDKKEACTNIYNQYQSHQDMKVWLDACMAAPDENVRCVNLVMDEGKDDDCKKLVSSPERTKLVTVLNGHPEAPAPTPPAPTGDAPPAPAPAPAPAPTGDAPPAPAPAPTPPG